jgi:hypothetical protein
MQQATKSTPLEISGSGSYITNDFAKLQISEQVLDQIKILFLWVCLILL